MFNINNSFSCLFDSFKQFKLISIPILGTAGLVLTSLRVFSTIRNPLFCFSIFDGASLGASLG